MTKCSVLVLCKVARGRTGFNVHSFANQLLHNNTERRDKEVGGGHTRVKMNKASYLSFVGKFPKRMSVSDHWLFLSIFSPFARFSSLL